MSNISKKIICIILCLCFSLLQAMPVLAEDTFYDFSDEAQEQFDKQELKQKNKLPANVEIIEHTDRMQSDKKSKKKKEPVVYEQPEVKSLPIITLNGKVLIVPAGESFSAILQSSISSKSLAENDTIAAVLNEDWYYNGTLVAPMGSVLYGKATDVKKAGYAYANGRLGLYFDEILTPKGEKIKLVSNKVFINVENKRPLKIATNVAIGAVSGILAGLMYTAFSGGDIGRAIAVGSAVGGAGGVVSAATQKGEDAEVPAGTIINVRLTKDMETVPYN